MDTTTHFATVHVERPARGMAIVRLMDAPVPMECQRVFDQVVDLVEGAEAVVLTGPGWRSSMPACGVTRALAENLRTKGIDVAIGHAA